MKLIRVVFFLFFLAVCFWGIIQYAPQLKSQREFPDGISIVLAFESQEDPFYLNISKLAHEITDSNFGGYNIQFLEFPIKDPGNQDLVRRYSITTAGIVLIKKRGAQEKVANLISSSRYMGGDEKLFSGMLITKLTEMLKDQPISAPQTKNNQIVLPDSSSE